MLLGTFATSTKSFHQQTSIKKQEQELEAGAANRATTLQPQASTNSGSEHRLKPQLSGSNSGIDK